LLDAVFYGCARSDSRHASNKQKAGSAPALALTSWAAPQVRTALPSVEVASAISAGICEAKRNANRLHEWARIRREGVDVHSRHADQRPYNRAVGQHADLSALVIISDQHRELGKHEADFELAAIALDGLMRPHPPKRERPVQTAPGVVT
jgi:hypothetical protein